MTTNIFETITATNGMVLIWSRYDLESANNKEISWISVESKTIDKKFFSGKNLENIISNLQNDPLALTLWISKDLDRILISKKKEDDE